MGGTNNWILNSNSSATNFISGDIVSFDDSATSTTVNLAAAVNPSLVTVNNTASSYAFQGSGKITGAGGLVKSGSGTLTIETDNDYTGTTSINAGTLQMGNGGTSGSVGSGGVLNEGTFVINRADNLALNFPVSGSGNLVKLGANMLTLSGSYSSTGAITISDGGLELDASQPVDITGNIDGAGLISKTGNSTATLSGNNTYSGGTTITAGTMIAANPTGSATGTGTTTINAGAILQVGNGATAGSVAGTVSNSGSILINRSDNFAIPADINGAGPIVKNGAGKASLTGNLSYNGNTTIQGGTLALAPAADFVYASTVAVGANSFEVDSASNVTLNGAISGTGNIIKSGSGTVFANADNTFTGTLTVNGGAFILQDDALVTGHNGNLNASHIVVNNGGTFQLGNPALTGQSPAENPDLPDPTMIDLHSGGTVSWYIGENYGGINFFGGALNLNSNNTFQSSIPLQWQSGTATGFLSVRSISGSATINKSTPGTVTLSSVNLNNTGGLNIQDGTISTDAGLTNTGILSFGTNGVGATTGTLLLTNTNTGSVVTLNRAVTLNDGGAIINVSVAGKTYNFAGQASGTGGITKDGPGTLILSGTNNYSGNTVVAGGTLDVAGSHTTGSSYSVSSGANLITHNIRATNGLTLDGAATVRPNGGTAGASKVETLTLNSGGMLNLTNNDLVIGTANLLSVRGQIKAGLSGSSNMAAATGITSDMMTVGVHGFGYALGDDVNRSPLIGGPGAGGDLSGQPYDANSVLVKFTYRGDADLDGDSDLDDLGHWANAFTGDLGIAPGGDPTTLWTQGDWDYDGDTDLDDLGFWSSTFTGDLGGSGLSVYAPNASDGAIAALASMGITAVPEPTAIWLLMIGFSAVALRASRRRK